MRRLLFWAKMCDMGSSYSSSLSILLVGELGLEQILGFLEFIDLITVIFLSLFEIFGEVGADGCDVLEDSGASLL